MRRLMTAICIASGFVLVVDAASARPRGGGSISKSSVAKSPVPNRTVPGSVARPAATAAKAQDRGVAPRTWIVAVPRATSQRPAQAAASADDQGAPLGFMPSVAASDEAKPSQPGAAAMAPAKPKQENTKLVVLNPSPPPKALPSGPQLPYDIGVCYWNRAGQCER